MKKVNKKNELINMYYKYFQLTQHPYKTLNDVYKSYSYFKEQAFDYCMKLVNEYNKDYTGNELYGIISYNWLQFTYGFLGIKDNEICFFYITKEQDKYASLSDIIKSVEK